MVIVQVARYKPNIRICLPYSYKKVFGKISALYNGIKLCQTLNINIDIFCGFKMYVKSLDLSVI